MIGRQVMIITMPIIGWSDDKDRVPRLGKIYLGVKLDNRPKAVDYFVVPDEVKAVYGEKPTELDVVFHSDNFDEIMPAWLKRYGDQTGLICRGDGQKAYIKTSYMKSAGHEYGVSYDPKKGFTGPDGKKLEIIKGEDKKDRVGITCGYRSCPFYVNKKCKEVAILNVLLPKVPGVLGVYSLDTSSINTYNNIKSGLLLLHKMFNRISMIKGLKLKVKMQEAHPEVGGKNLKTHVPVCYITMGEYTLYDLMNMVEQRDLLTVRHLLPGETIDVEPLNEEEKPDLLFVEDNSQSEDTKAEDVINEDSPDDRAHNPPQVKDLEKTKQHEDKSKSQPSADNPQTTTEVRALPEKEQTANSKDNQQPEPGRSYVTFVRLVEKIPVRTVKVQGADTWFFTAERNTTKGLLRGKLLIPKQVASDEFVKSLRVGDILKVISESVVQGKEFIITATLVEISQKATRAS